MRVVQKILITFAMVIGLSIAAFAQKGEDPKKPPPPKPNPPVVTPGDKKPPKGEEKPPPKKPGSEFAVVFKEKGIDLG